MSRPSSVVVRSLTALARTGLAPAALALAALLVAPPAAAQSAAPQPAVLSGDFLPGGGRVTGVELVHMSAFTGWAAVVTTDDPARPKLVLRDGAPFKAVGDLVTQPADATLAGFASLSTELFGGITFVARLDGTAGGVRDDQAVYFENKLWAQKGPLPVPNLWDVHPGTVLRSLDDVRCSTAGGTVLFRGEHDDPTIAGPSETFLAVGSLCGSIGNLCTVDRVLVDGQIVSQPGVRLASVNLAPHGAAVSPGGTAVLWSGHLQDPGGEDPGCIGRFTFPANVSILIEEGGSSPVPGRTWGPLDQVALDVNSSGLFTVRATLDDSDLTNDEVLVRGAQLLAREGDPAPGIPGAVYTRFGRGPALVNDAGDTVWYARLQGPGGPGEAIFADGTPVVRTGVTRIGGRLLVALDDSSDTLSLAPQGGRILFTGRLENGQHGAFLLDLD